MCCFFRVDGTVEGSAQRSAGWERPRLGGDVRVASVYMARERLKRASNAVGFGNHSGLPVSGTAHPV